MGVELDGECQWRQVEADEVLTLKALHCVRSGTCSTVENHRNQDGTDWPHSGNRQWAVWPETAKTRATHQSGGRDGSPPGGCLQHSS